MAGHVQYILTHLHEDKYRAAAKQAAWYSDDDDPNPNYNPFRKTRSRPQVPGQADEEKGLQPPPTNRSESQLTHSVEILRRSQNQEALQQPKHADTMPSSSQPSSSQHCSGKSPVDAQSSVKDFNPEQEKDLSREHEKSQDSGTTESDTVVPSDFQPEVKEEKPRRRFTKKFPFVSKSKKEEDGEDLQKKRKGSSLWGKETQKFTAASQLRATLFNSWINVLLIFVPIGIAVNFANVPKVGVFVINFIAIIPLAAMLSYATEEIALRTGETIGGLLNATFG